MDLLTSRNTESSNMQVLAQNQNDQSVNKIDSTYVMNFLQVAYPDGFLKKYGRFLHS